MINSCGKCRTELTQKEIRFYKERDVDPMRYYCTSCEEYDYHHNLDRQKADTELEMKNERKYFGMRKLEWIICGIIIGILYLMITT